MTEGVEPIIHLLKNNEVGIRGIPTEVSTVDNDDLPSSKGEENEELYKEDEHAVMPVSLQTTGDGRCREVKMSACVSNEE